MVVTTENPDGSWTTEVVYPCGIIVNANVGIVIWDEINGPGYGTSSFAGKTFYQNEYDFGIEAYPDDESYEGLKVSLAGVTADEQGWIHVFVPHP